MRTINSFKARNSSTTISLTKRSKLQAHSKLRTNATSESALTKVTQESAISIHPCLKLTLSLVNRSKRNPKKAKMTPMTLISKKPLIKELFSTHSQTCQALQQLIQWAIGSKLFVSILKTCLAMYHSSQLTDT